MKTSHIQTRLKRLATATVALWLGGSALTLRADSPVGDWDFYLSGGMKGVAHITFNTNYSISGVEIHSPGTLPKKPSNNPRSPVINGDNPRGGEDPNLGTEFHCGSTVISGTWGYGINGKIVGAMILASATATNGWSFTGVAKVSNTRSKMTLIASRSDSGVRTVLRGVMRAPLVDISGSYSEAGVMVNRINWTSQGYSRILTLTSPTNAPMNVYAVSEDGPGYLGGGFAILTRNNYLGIYTEHYAPGTTNTELIVVSGKFNTNSLRGSMTGYDADRHIIKTKVVNFP